MDRKAEFLKIWTERVRREYADDLLAWLERETDFFEAPASTRHHGAHPGGLLDHSLNVYHRLRAIVCVETYGTTTSDLLAEDVEETVAVMAGIVSDDVAGWMGGEAAGMASYVPVTFRGYQLFQEVNGRQAYGVDPTALAIVERATAEMGTAAISGGRALAWSHDGETVMLGAIRKTTWAWDWERTVWEAMESVDLHKKEG